MKDTTPARIRIRRFITDRYVYRTQPAYLFELLVFGIIMATAFLRPCVFRRTNWSVGRIASRTTHCALFALAHGLEHFHQITLGKFDVLFDETAELGKLFRVRTERALDNFRAHGA